MSKLLFQEQVERWGMLEVSCQGPAEGNPFVDHHIQGVFTGEKETVKTDGFYDGDGVYKVRFMPSFEGSYRFTISADFLEKEETGSFVSLPAGEGNHGPVRVADTYHFHMRTEQGTIPSEPPVMYGICSQMKELHRRWKH